MKFMSIDENEFINSEFQKFITEYGIEYKFISPDCAE